MLCRAGWCFVQRPDNVVLTHVASGFVAGETATYAGCPWVRLYPSVRGFGAVDNDLSGRCFVKV